MLPIPLLLACSAAIGLASALAPPECQTYQRWVSHDGCTLFVWRGINASVWVEPTFCVPEPKLWLNGGGGGGGLCINYDPIGGYSYANVPVMLTNRTLLNAAAAKLGSPRPNSVKYLGFDDVRVAKATGWPPGTRVHLKFEPRELIWSQSEDFGVLRLSCDGIACSVLENMIREHRWDQLLEPLMVTVRLTPECGSVASARPVTRSIAVQGANYQPLWGLARDSDTLPECRGVSASAQKVADVTVGDGSCRLRLHGRGESAGAASGLLAEPLLCYAGGASQVYDYNRGRHYVALRLLLHVDPATLGEAAAAASVTFMRLLDPGPVGQAAGDLLLETGGDSMLMRVPCADVTACDELLSAIASDPLVIFSRVKWRPTVAIAPATAGMPECRLKIAEDRHSVPLRPPAGSAASGCPAAFPCGTIRCQLVRLADGRNFVAIQQRRSASVRFDRNWTDYVAGFGDVHNFWIGLKNIASLAGQEGSLLRIEAKLWNGTKLHAEYSRVRLQGSRYNLTYDRYLQRRSNFGTVDMLESSRNAPFMTADAASGNIPWGVQYYEYQESSRYGRQHVPRGYLSMAQLGNAGWWWSTAGIKQMNFNPNGIFHYGETLPPPASNKLAFVGLNLTVAGCASDSKRDGSAGGKAYLEWKFLKEIRLMLQV